MANNQLRQMIRDQYKTESSFARTIGWSRQKLSKTILGKRSPKISDINTLSRALNASVNEIVSFFGQ